MLADDHTIVRQGLAGLLRAYEEFEVVAEAADGSEALEKAFAVRPDVVVLDISMPGLPGLEVARRIRRHLPTVRILVLTMHDEQEYVFNMVRAGASGYLVKDGAASELVAAIRALHRGQPYFGPQAARALARSSAANRPADPYESLTQREREVFHLVAEGRTNAQIAAVLRISPKTVDNHRTRLNEKLGVHSAAELLRYAAKHGLLC